jgi:hypothetical protein
MGFYPQDARLEPLYSRFFPRFFQQFSDCARVTGKPEVIPAEPIRAITSGWPTNRPKSLVLFWLPLVSWNLPTKTTICRLGDPVRQSP